MELLLPQTLCSCQTVATNSTMDAAHPQLRNRGCQPVDGNRHLVIATLGSLLQKSRLWELAFGNQILKRHLNLCCLFSKLLRCSPPFIIVQSSSSSLHPPLSSSCFLCQLLLPLFLLVLVPLLFLSFLFFRFSLRQGFL